MSVYILVLETLRAQTEQHGLSQNGYGCFDPPFSFMLIVLLYVTTRMLVAGNTFVP
jgi:hypothetical protein